MSRVGRVVEILGGAAVLGGEPRSEADLVPLIRAGLPYRAYEAVLAHLEVGPDDPILEALRLPKRTLQRRKAQEQLAPGESERVVRLARIIERATDVLGAGDKAVRWIGAPNRALGGHSPMSLLDTDLGVQQVEATLTRIEHGIVS
jgi:putative toxin-antitoxin system antitoxin component (TIGR02293 family)